jgi:hypothetical protein
LAVRGPLESHHLLFKPKSDGPRPGRICPGRPSLKPSLPGFRWRRCGDSSWWLTGPPMRLAGMTPETKYLAMLRNYSESAACAQAASRRRAGFRPGSMGSALVSASSLVAFPSSDPESLDDCLPVPQPPNYSEFPNGLTGDHLLRVALSYVCPVEQWGAKTLAGRIWERQYLHPRRGCPDWPRSRPPIRRLALPALALPAEARPARPPRRRTPRDCVHLPWPGRARRRRHPARHPPTSRWSHKPRRY